MRVLEYRDKLKICFLSRFKNKCSFDKVVHTQTGKNKSLILGVSYRERVATAVSIWTCSYYELHIVVLYLLNSGYSIAASLNIPIYIDRTRSTIRTHWIQMLYTLVITEMALSKLPVYYWFKRVLYGHIYVNHWMTTTYSDGFR